MADDLAGLLAYIYRHEARGNYDQWNHGTRIRGSKPLTQMTVGEVLAVQRKNLRLPKKYRFTAAGAGQFLYSTLKEEVEKGTVALDDMFDKATQDRLTVSRLKFRGLDAFMAGKIGAEDFGTRLAMEWASLPVMKDTYRGKRFIPRGNGYYGGVSNNPSKVNASVEEFASVLADPGTYDAAQWTVRVSAMNGTTMLDPAGTRTRPGAAARYREQAYRPGSGPASDYPWAGSATHRINTASLPGQEPGAGEAAFATLPTADYSVRGAGGGSGQDLSGGRWDAFSDAFMDSFIVRRIGDAVAAGQYDYDMSFDPAATAVKEGFAGQVAYLGRAKNRAHYDYLKRSIADEEERAYRREVYDGWIAPFLGSALNPDSLVSLAIPGGIFAAAGRKAGTTAARAALNATGATLVYEAAVETGRAGLDPLSTPADSLLRAGGSVALSGLFNGIGAAWLSRSARRSLAKEFGEDMAAARGIGHTTGEVDLGGGRVAKVEIVKRAGKGEAPAMHEAGPSGIRIAEGRVFVDPDVLVGRIKAADPAIPSGIRTANELMEYEIGRQAAMAKPRAARFLADESGSTGKREWTAPFVETSAEAAPEANRARIEDALEKGDPILLGDGTGRTPIEIDSRFFRSADEAEAMVMRAHEAAVQARDDMEFRDMVDGLLGARGGIEAAETAAGRLAHGERLRAADEAGRARLEDWRGKNNRILRDRKARALSRLMDGPYKRIHRNALSGRTRDLVDRLAADGAFLRGSDGSGVNVGPSVYSRAKTWLGVVRRLWDAERRLYAKYLGLDENPAVGDVAKSDFTLKRASGGRAMPMEEFRRRVSQAYITGQKDDIPEIMEMVEHLRGAWDEYAAVADGYGVISGQKTLATQADLLRQRIADLDPEHPVAKMIQSQLDEIEKRRGMAKGEPGEDYFTRVWNHVAIRENREAFIERIVKPWMRQQPWVDVWQEGSDTLQRQIDDLKAAGVDINQPRYQALRNRLAEAVREGRTGDRWERIKTSDRPEDFDRRARQMVETILEEAEPADLATGREAHRPTFGRHRQFDVPNSLLLKDGPKGNGIADFIETDYLLVHRVYADRMGPAIEMARSFARPADGVSAKEGFEDALFAAKEAELKAWDGKNGGFAEHWAPIERDLLHLRDRVTNRVIRRPDRWDNRTATALRNWSNLAFMGLSGLNSVQDIGVIVMRHGAGRTFRMAFGQLDDGMKQAAKAGVEEMRKAGAILDVAMGGALSRFAETGMDAVHGTAPERWLRTASNKYFLWNGLAPLTTRMKEIDAALRVHDMVERIDRVGNGVATKADLEELDRWGIGREDAQAIARSEPIVQTEEGAWLANTDAWGDENLVRKFRAAIAQGNENTVLMASAADKPIIVDGTVYLRKGGRVDLYATLAGLESQGGYWRVQSGLMTLPFQFWNYALAAFNKILVAGLDEPSSQKLGGMAAMLGMGYMLSAIKTPEHVWDGLTAEDKIARAVEQSGIAGVLGTYANLFQTADMALTGSNPFPFRPTRGRQNPSVADAAFSLMGAGPGVMRNFVGGTLGTDLDTFSWALPTRNHIGLKWLWDAAIDGIERSSSGMDVRQ